jgi:hypothetical protein
MTAVCEVCKLRHDRRLKFTSFLLPKRSNLFLELRMSTTGATCYRKQAFAMKQSRHTCVSVDNIGLNIASNMWSAYFHHLFYEAAYLITLLFNDMNIYWYFDSMEGTGLVLIGGRFLLVKWPLFVSPSPSTMGKVYWISLSVHSTVARQFPVRCEWKKKYVLFLRAIFYASCLPFVTKSCFLSFTKGCYGISVTEIQVELKRKE